MVIRHWSVFFNDLNFGGLCCSVYQVIHFPVRQLHTASHGQHSPQIGNSDFTSERFGGIACPHQLPVKFVYLSHHKFIIRFYRKEFSIVCLISSSEDLSVGWSRTEINSSNSMLQLPFLSAVMNSSCLLNVVVRLA